MTTRDSPAVAADGVLFYQVLDPVKAVYEVQDLGDAIETLCMTTLRNVMGSMELDGLLSQRDTINAKLLPRHRRRHRFLGCSFDDATPLVEAAD